MAVEHKTTANREDLIESSGTKKRNLTNDEAQLVQKPFLAALKRKMDADGLSPTQLAKRIGIAYSYLVALTSGMRLIANAERQRVEKFADYLEVPVIQIYIWGGLLSPKDFIVKTTLDKTLDNIFKIMEADPTLIGILPTEVEWANRREFSGRAKLLVAQLFELYSNKMLIERAKLVPEKQKTGRTKHILARNVHQTSSN